uniref:Ig-like domain-containing protein n=1 Tax=Rufibacter sp. XAAS-G3-1 TaxID=2729134 RepID=UPI0015E74A45
MSNRPFLFLLFFLLLTQIGYSQSESRIRFTSVSASANTGQDYSPWLSDNLGELVESEWAQRNMTYVDVTLTLERRSEITRLALYDHQGIFTTNPVTVYALDGGKKTLIGTFTGESYLSWVSLKPAKPLMADAILIRKYGNNIPQKIQAYGNAGTLAQAVIDFPAPAGKTVGDAPFELGASSTNAQAPISFSSSNPAVVSVSNASGKWSATVLSAGTATITASQPATNGFAAPAPVARTLAVAPAVAQSQSESRIRFTSVSASANTGQDYSPWLSDNLGELVESEWAQRNMTYVDVTLTLERRSEITRLALYDHQGIFTTNPVTVYALDGGKKTLIGTFTGESYLSWVSLKPAKPLMADAILIRKYGNNIPQKIQAYGNAGTLAQAVIDFPAPAGKTVGDAPFELGASSTNAQAPISFSSSNPAVVSVSNASGKWSATVLSAGTATITASQPATNGFAAPAPVARTL